MKARRKLAATMVAAATLGYAGMPERQKDGWIWLGRPRPRRPVAWWHLKIGLGSGNPEYQVVRVPHPAARNGVPELRNTRRQAKKRAMRELGLSSRQYVRRRKAWRKQLERQGPQPRGIPAHTPGWKGDRAA